MKVFDISMPRTGTKSLCLAMAALGMKSTHGPDKYTTERFYKQIIQGQVATSDLVKRYEFVGHMTPFVDHLHHEYPDALWIMLDRDEESWLESCKRHLLKNRNLIRLREARDQQHVPYSVLWRLLVFGTAKYNREMLQTRWSTHVKHVKELLGASLLVTKITDGWKPLSEFIGRHPPDDLEFPCYRYGGRGWYSALKRHHEAGGV